MVFQGLKRLMTKCQQYFITEPSRSVDFVRQEAHTTPSTSQLQTVEPKDTIRKVSFTSAGTGEERDKEVGASSAEQT